MYDAINELAESKERAKPPKIKLIPVPDFMDMDIPPYACLLEPWLPKAGIVMLFAPRGLGKTMVAMGLGCNLSAGKDFLGYSPEQSYKVVYVDGEMPASLIQKRLRKIVQDRDATTMQVISNDLLESGRINLALETHRDALEEAAGDFDLLIIDNYSTLYGYEKENDAVSWAGMEDWLLKLRRLGKCVILIHHAGKNGLQRGSSAKEIICDAIISLKRAVDEGDVSIPNSFEWHWDKYRSFYAEDAHPFMVTLANVAEDDRIDFKRTEIIDGYDQKKKKIHELVQQGKSLRDIEKLTGIPKSTVSRLAKEK